MSNNQNVGIAYFTTPSVEIEPLGKIVEGVMVQVARQTPVRKVNSDYEVTIVEELKPELIPSLIFTDSSGKVQHLRVEGNQLSSITVEGVMNIVKDINDYNKNNPNG